MFWGFKYDIFKNIRKFKREEVEVVFWESKAKPSEEFEFKICHRKHFRNYFWSYLEVKTNALTVWKSYFSLFCCKFLSHKVEKDFCESQAKRSKLLKSNMGYKKHYRKWFSSYREVKNRSSEPLKVAF